MAKGLQTIRREQIAIINQLQESPPGQTVPISFSFHPVAPLTNKLITELEKDILFLVKITNRQKMDQALNLERELEKLTESLRDKFEKIKNQKAPIIHSELKKQIDKIEQTFRQMMEQLSLQTKGLPDEFLNPESLKQLNLDNFQASLEKIKKMIDQGDIQAAMEELEKMTQDLQSLANQLDQSEDAMDDLMDMETMEKIDDSLEDLGKLEKSQEDLLEKTTKLNKKLRKAQLEKFENQLSKFFEDLKKDVNAAQKNLDETTSLLKENPDMNNHVELLEKQAHLNSKIHKLNQETVDSALKPNLPEKFNEVRKTREQISNVTRQRNSLHLDEYYKFQRSLPEMIEKYDALEELTKLLDLKEFNELFKNTYPLAFRWEHNLRMVLQPNKELAESLSTKLNELRKTNAEISKKLGTFNREMKKEFEALISDKNKELLNSMAKRQNELRQEASDLAEKLAEMGKVNPMVPPQLSQKMGSAQQFMKSAQKNLSKKNVPQSVNSENQALRQLGETREMLDEMKNQKGQGKAQGRPKTPGLGTGKAPDSRRGGSMRMQREKVDLPSEDEYQAPTKFRDEIIQAMKRQYPKNYERFISEYYKELVK
jgi:ABC-type transporter Mla subunit MlaD